MKNVKMFFTRDVFYTDLNKPLFLGGHTYDIPENLVFKWLKRGAQIIEEKPKAAQAKKVVPSAPALEKTEPVVVEPTMTEEKPKTPFKRK